jgi:hypothetical protein
VVVEGVLEDLEELVEAVLAAVWIFGKSSENCRVGLFWPILTAIGYSSCRALCRRAVVGRLGRLSSVGSNTSFVAPPKLVVSDSAISAVCSVYGYI